jgi:hypothetical protein
MAPSLLQLTPKKRSNKHALSQSVTAAIFAGDLAAAALDHDAAPTPGVERTLAFSCHSWRLISQPSQRQVAFCPGKSSIIKVSTGSPNKVSCNQLRLGPHICFY